MNIHQTIELDPADDYIITLSLPALNDKLQPIIEMIQNQLHLDKITIGGSFLLKMIIEALDLKWPTSWTCNDIDVYLFNQAQFEVTRLNVELLPYPIELVKKVESSPLEFLVKIDLPCSRMCLMACESTSHHTLYISLKCLLSLMTKTYEYPSYVFDDQISNPLSVEQQQTFDRFKLAFHRRVEKYKERGFQPIPKLSTKVLPWIAGATKALK